MAHLSAGILKIDEIKLLIYTVMPDAVGRCLNPNRNICRETNFSECPELFSIHKVRR
jgi:hypothetical protein